ncbi:hypothetical protein P0O24_09005 [Methanotrichaceae archaeon M04Ac]|uniref:HEPN domain-containing protein n=1 Tax=Candidatus Methanocrinis alkalitolerans TaxID=3033395 RepID=A0ABT5XGG5_9EURY|nr:hypothetical protein [Candidatus Methanocrinis alkalitolerans]MDF0593721.1 hypothetical protein [Candidatus Methanocrinis alkalitolerans]
MKLLGPSCRNSDPKNPSTQNSEEPYFFADNQVLFRKLSDNYNQETYRFEFKSLGERNQALKLLERNGFDAYPIENLKGYMVKLDKFSKYTPVLRNSVAFTETPKERIFLMKDLAAVEEAIEFCAEIYKGDVAI